MGIDVRKSERRPEIEDLLGRTLVDASARWEFRKTQENAPHRKDGFHDGLVLVVPKNVASTPARPDANADIQRPIIVASYGIWGADDVAADLARFLGWAFVKSKNATRSIAATTQVLDENDKDLKPYVVNFARNLLRGRSNPKRELVWSLDFGITEVLSMRPGDLDHYDSYFVLLDPTDDYLDWARNALRSDDAAFRAFGDPTDPRTAVESSMRELRNRGHGDKIIRVKLERPGLDGANEDVLSDLWTETTWEVAKQLFEWPHKGPDPGDKTEFHKLVHHGRLPEVTTHPFAPPHA